jgi:hypothetical protein
MTRPRRADFSRIRTISVLNRKSTVTLRDHARPVDGARASFAEFSASMPRFLAAANLRTLVDDIVRSRRRKKPVIVMMGAHVVKVGLAPVVIDLLERGVITAVAMNSAAAIHDVETALWGRTSEDVAENILDGTFGMARETGEFINGTLTAAHREGDLGYGEALGRRLLAEHAPHAGSSLLASCARLTIPLTVHAAIGTDIVHQQPSMDGAATGEMSFRDFRQLCDLCRGLTGGGVVLNIGSAVIMPEVFLKALTVARNLGAPARGFTTAVFDMFPMYRPTMNVKLRPTQDGGRGLSFLGHHEILVPLLAAMIRERLAVRKARRG